MKAQNCRIDILNDRAAACALIADEVEDRVRFGAVLGLATGASPLPLYAEWTRRHREQGLSFRSVTSFNLDEYEGLGRGDPDSFQSFMDRELFSKVNIGRTLVPPGLYRDPEEAAKGYERQIKGSGGIEWQLLGIGRSGHIGFNEPGSARDSRTRRVELAPETREDAVATFGGLDRVPTHAMTMGIGTILEAKRIVLIGWGTEKAALVRRALDGPITEDFPASFLQLHPSVRVVLAEVEGAW